MCLGYGKKKSEQRDFIRDLKFGKDKYIKLWKVFDLDEDSKLVGQFHRFNFCKGKNTASGKVVKNLDRSKSSHQYIPGFHCWLTKSNAEWWRENALFTGGNKRVVKFVKVKKSWITHIGWQDEELVLVCKHIII